MPTLEEPFSANARSDTQAVHPSHAAHERSGPFRILHISDIHFGYNFDASVWAYLKALARREKPNLIVCTGDLVDHGGLFMLAAAKLELESLRKEAGPSTKLSCVPGNHDCGPWGLFNLRPFSTNFAALFGPKAIEVPTWMSGYVDYQRRNLAMRSVQRAALTPWLYLKKWTWGLALKLCGHSLSDLPTMRGDNAPTAVVLMHFDSNHAQWTASGSINPAAVTGLKAQLLNLRDEDGASAYAPRIALMHHHALPIPEASITEGLTSFEPFLVLRNAGFVLRELNNCDVDLILHGHKHYSSFSRLGYSVDHQDEGEIAVLAAGSCGITHSESGRNSVNIIDVLETGRMSYTAIYFGGGGGAPVHELFRNRRDVHGIEMHKARIHRRASERQGQWAQSASYKVAVDQGGVALVHHQVRGHVFGRSQASDVIPIYVDVTMGRVAHTTFELLPKYRLASYEIVNPPTSAETSIRAGLKLGRRLATSPPTSYGYRYLCFNTYAITEWETIAACKRDARQGNEYGRAKGLEFTSYIVRIPLKNLVMQLSLPPDAGPVKIAVRVMRWSSYPNTELDSARHFFPNAKGHWELDSDLTAHESGKLVRIPEDTWELRVLHPMVGHRYDLLWSVTNDERDFVTQKELTARRGRTEEYRKLLSTPSHELRLGLSEAFSRLQLLMKLYFSASLSAEDDLEITMFFYDSENSSFRQISIRNAPQEEDSEKCLEVPLGEGVVAAAFKRSDFVIYVDPKLSGDSNGGVYLFDKAEQPWAEPKWKFVSAFPIFAINDLSELKGDAIYQWGPQTTIGVVTISSKASDSGLLRLVDSSEDEDEDEEPFDIDENPLEVDGNRPAVAPHEPRDTEQILGTEPVDIPSASSIWGYAHALVISAIKNSLTSRGG